MPRSASSPRTWRSSRNRAAILEPDRAPIVDALGKRGFARPRIEALAKAAKELADDLGGRVAMAASPHTELEAAAVVAQTEHWKACRRMIAKAAKADRELAELWAAC